MLDAANAGPAFLDQLNSMGVPWITDGTNIWVHRTVMTKLFGIDERTARRKLQGLEKAPCSKAYFLFHDFLSREGH